MLFSNLSRKKCKHAAFVGNLTRIIFRRQLFSLHAASRSFLPPSASTWCHACTCDPTQLTHNHNVPHGPNKHTMDSLLAQPLAQISRSSSDISSLHFAPPKIFTNGFNPPILPSITS